MSPQKKLYIKSFIGACIWFFVIFLITDKGNYKEILLPIFFIFSWYSVYKALEKDYGKEGKDGNAGKPGN